MPNPTDPTDTPDHSALTATVAASRWLPLVVAWPMFLQNMDTTILATALPSMAHALGVPVLHLNLAITAYLLSLALFLPISGWVSERWGAKRLFCIAIALFTLGSLLCGLSRNLPELVSSRLLQGVGGAMMVPVARLILLHHIKPAEMIRAMVWFTVPGTIARLTGPLIGGGVVTLASWRWIFIVQLPLGLLGIFLAWRMVPSDAALKKQGPRASLDAIGFGLLALGLLCLIAGLELGGKSLVSPAVMAALIGAGMVALWFYRQHSASAPHPLIDLQIFRHFTYRTATVGAIPLRVAIGAAPFLLPLLMQVGFGLSPLQSGFMTFAGAIGSLSSRTTLPWMLRRFGFRAVLIAGTVGSSLCYAGYGLFTASTPHAAMFGVMLLGGLFNACAMVALNTLGYSDIPRDKASHATTAATMVNQLSVTFGVVVGSSLLALASRVRGGPGAPLLAIDFAWVFFAIGAFTVLCVLGFRKLKADDGAQMR
ncbi:MFS transporter [Hydrogenophaga sp.]|uniref:MFS transporter n=1 Tax=Hydrogenophaga sp. TaxID=1904254 RepID=UPI00271A3488|nr:MFS transporter [Hydrogenophaga sp.]MDO9434845.1 MFS transporter [Hydrogenophaga sp.]